MATWADEARVLELTGVSVTSDLLFQAQNVLDVFTGVTTDAMTDLTARDARLLGQALAYQAAWMARQLDVFTRMDVQDVSQDGASFTPANDDALFLAPLARRVLKRLSWHRRPEFLVSGFSCDAPVFTSQQAVEAGFLRDRGVGLGESPWDWTPLP